MSEMSKKEMHVQAVRQASYLAFTSDYIANKIVELHSEPHRAYHNCDHLHYMLVKAMGYPTGHPIYKAILTHDIVYYPQSKNNEELSAAYYYYLTKGFAVTEMQLRSDVIEAVNDEDILVTQAILASKNHTNIKNSLLNDWQRDFLDFDLMAMSDSRLYRMNAYKIWQEFEPTTFKNDFIEGRTKWLKMMLDSKQLYWNHPEAEEPTRQNMAAEYQSLKAKNYIIEEYEGDVVYFYGDDLIHSEPGTWHDPEWVEDL